MNQAMTLNVATEVKGNAVLDQSTGEKLGEVQDVILHPVEGRVLGISLRARDGKMQTLLARDCSMGRDAVMVSPDAEFEDRGFSGALAGGVYAAEELTGVTVVSEDGTVIGRITDVYISSQVPEAAYHVTESALQRLFGGGIYLPASAAMAFSPDGTRIIVPAGTLNTLAARTPGEAIQHESRKASGGQTGT